MASCIIASEHLNQNLKKNVKSPSGTSLARILCQLLGKHFRKVYELTFSELQSHTVYLHRYIDIKSLEGREQMGLV